MVISCWKSVLRFVWQAVAINAAAGCKHNKRQIITVAKLCCKLDGIYPRNVFSNALDFK